MKTQIICIMFAMAMSILMYGCFSDSIQIIRNDKVVTNTVPLRAFNDEHYVWENWTISTNKIENIPQ